MPIAELDSPQFKFPETLKSLPLSGE